MPQKSTWVLDARTTMPSGSTVGDVLYQLVKAGHIIISSGKIEVVR